MDAPENVIEVRATIALPDLPVGSLVLVDPTDPYIAGCLEAAFLVPTEPQTAQEPPSVAVDPDTYREALAPGGVVQGAPGGTVFTIPEPSSPETDDDAADDET